MFKYLAQNKKNILERSKTSARIVKRLDLMDKRSEIHHVASHTYLKSNQESSIYKELYLVITHKNTHYKKTSKPEIFHWTNTTFKVLGERTDNTTNEYYCNVSIQDRFISFKAAKAPTHHSKTLPAGTSLESALHFHHL